MKSNCLIWAIREWRRRDRRGCEAYIGIRRSRLAPWVPHFLISCLCHGTASFCPIDPRPLTWRNVWKALRFEGRVVQGDTR